MVKTTGRDSRPPEILDYLPYILAIFFAGCFFTYSVDDSYITFRYAANLLHGYGPVYNAGERVEGISSLLHMAVCASILSIFPTVDILIKAKLLSLAFGLATLNQLGRFADDLCIGRGGRVLSQILVSVTVPFALANINALETTLYSFLLLAAIRLLYKSIRKHDSTGVWPGAMLFLATLARPDCIVIFGFLAGGMTLVAFRTGEWKARRNLILSYVLTYGVCYLALTCARYAYYGLPLPTTYYAKWQPVLRAAHFGALYLVRPRFPLREFAIPIGFAFGISLWSSLLLGTWLTRRELGWRIWPILVIAAQCAFVLRAGGDWVQGWRFVVPVLPLICLLQTESLLRLYALAAGGRNFRRVSWAVADGNRGLCVCGLLIIASSLTGLVCLAFLRPMTWSSIRYSNSGADFLRPWGWGWASIAEYLRENVRSGQTVATSEIGYAGYMNPKVRILDTRGLTDAGLARDTRFARGSTGITDRKWRNPDDPMYQYLLANMPDAIITYDVRGPAPLFVLGRYRFDRYLNDHLPGSSAKRVMVFLPMPKQQAGQIRWQSTGHTGTRSTSGPNVAPSRESASHQGQTRS